MKVETSFETFKTLSKSKRPVAISATIYTDQITPVSLFEKIYHYFGNGCLIEITDEQSKKVLMGFEPRGFFQIKNKTCEAIIDGKTHHFNESSLDSLRKFKKLSRVETHSSDSELANSMVGLISYDAVRLFEETLNQPHVSHNAPKFLFYCYRINLTFDLKKQAFIISIITDIKSPLKQSYEKAIHDLEKLHTILKSTFNEIIFDENKHNNTPIESDISDFDYQSMVKKAKTYIQQGEIFQVVPSRCFKKSYQKPPFHIYRTLRNVTPAPYLFYIDNGEQIILGASPEKLVSVKNNHVETVPIAGTCKNSDPETIHALLNDEKELAEHMMLVDLARNDLGKVCIPGSVQIESLLKPKKAGNLTHLTTVVCGKLNNTFDALDALKAVFPAGTVSGAPKIRAMEIIDELETTPRDFYAGAFCIMDNAGNLDSAIMIRTMILKNGIATVRAGGGIVFDSIPEKEAQESEAKAFSILRAC